MCNSQLVSGSGMPTQSWQLIILHLLPGKVLLLLLLLMLLLLLLFVDVYNKNLRKIVQQAVI
jgi:hypothetical protein